ncbi:hypothetical protein KCP76_13680 [Salmonella enterica subsp. enterica serovar Weltevreden]|nr:hypothetical protein KCP76_13680 [Salmonella enterica subsp. enterica serovar Weltevreden]
MKLFWLDEAEPEFSVWPDNYRYCMPGRCWKWAISTHVCTLKPFDGMKADGEDSYQPATRCAPGPAVRSSAHWSGRGIFTPRLDRYATVCRRTQ